MRVAILLGAFAATLATSCGDDDDGNVRGDPDGGGSGSAGDGGGGSGSGGKKGGASSSGGAAAPVTECFGEPLPDRAVASLERPAPPDGLESYVATQGFQTAAPEDVGMDADAVETALEFSVNQANTEALLIIRHGYIVGERYFGNFSESTRHESYSMAKSVTSALIGIAIEEGSLTGTDDRICKYYDEWTCDDPDDLHGAITVEHAMNINTGLQWEEDWRGFGAQNDAFSSDILGTALSRPVVEPPGTHTRYSTGDPALLTGVIQGATGRTVFEYATEKLFEPLGITDVAWASDSAGRTTAYAGLSMTARDFAKFGQLFLQEGTWDGESLVPSAWITATTQADDRCADQYKDLWHINPPMRLGTPDPACEEIIGCRPLEIANLPGEAYFAEGAFGQAVYVIPSQDLVAVRLASDPLDSDLWDEVSKTFLGAVLDAVRD